MKLAEDDKDQYALAGGFRTLEDVPDKFKDIFLASQERSAARDELRTKKAERIKTKSQQASTIQNIRKLKHSMYCLDKVCTDTPGDITALTAALRTAQAAGATHGQLFDYEKRLDALCDQETANIVQLEEDSPLVDPAGE